MAALSAMIPVDSLAQEGTADGGPAATPAAATPAAPTESQPDFWSRPTLSGDWWGARSELADHGVNLRLFATGYYQGQWTGEAGVFTADDGRGTRFLTGGRLDGLIDLDTTRLGLWRGGGFHVHLEPEGGRVPGFRGGALWPVNTSAVLHPAGRGISLAAAQARAAPPLPAGERLWPPPCQCQAPDPAAAADAADAATTP